MTQQFYGLASRRVLLGMLICLLMATASPAASLVWDPDSDGNGTSGGVGIWDTVTPLLNWYDATFRSMRLDRRQRCRVRRNHRRPGYYYTPAALA